MPAESGARHPRLGCDGRSLWDRRSSLPRAIVGSSTTNALPRPGVDSTQMRPPFASTKPFAIARPSPDPARVSPPRRRLVERLEDPLPLSARDPRPAVDHADDRPIADRQGADHHRLAIRIARRILHQVRQHPLDLREIGAHRRKVRIDPHPELPPRAVARPVPRRSPPRPSTPPVAGRRRAPPASTDRADRRSASPTGFPRRPRGFRARRARPRSPPGTDRGAGGDHRGNRRAKIVRDRAQDRRLDRLAAAQPLCLYRLGDEPLPFERQLEYGAERGHRSLTQSGHGALRHVRPESQRAQPPPAHRQQDRQPAFAAGRVSASVIVAQGSSKTAPAAGR